MAGVIPNTVGLVLILSFVLVLGMVFAALMVPFVSSRFVRPRHPKGGLCDRSEIPSADEIAQFVRSLTPEDFAAAEKFAAEFRRANGRLDS